MSKLPPLTMKDLSNASQKRLRNPKRRGAFRPIDGARAQQALCSAADEGGQARVYTLIDVDQHTIADARFIAFGSLASHAIADQLCDQIRGLPVSEALSITGSRVEQQLRDSSETEAFPNALAYVAFVDDILAQIGDAQDSLVVLKKPVEVERYQRKREQDWDDKDQAWLPLSLLKKIGAVQKNITATINERLGGKTFAWSVEGLHDDFKIVMKVGGIDADEIETFLQFARSGLRAAFHPQLDLELAYD